MTQPGVWWRLVLGLAVFTVWAPPALAGLPFAALTLVARPRRLYEWWAAAVAAALSVGLLLLPPAGKLQAATNGYTVLVTAAFVLLTIYWPGRFLGRAVRAIALGGVATAGLAWAFWGGGFWGSLHREAGHAAGLTARRMLAGSPDALALLAPAARAAGDLAPAMLVLQTLAGLGLAWAWHQRVAERPLGEPLGPFRELRFSEHWIWAGVAALLVWTAPWLATLKTAALNVVVVTGALYFLRGAAVAAAFAQVTGIPAGALVMGGVLAAVLAVPLLVLVPGLWTLGVTDTWLEFRRRFAARANVQ